MSDLLPVTQADRDAVQAFHRIMAARLMNDIASGRPTMGEDEGDAGTLVQAFARHRLAALDSRAGDAGGKALFEHEMRQRGVDGLWADLDEDEREGWRESARAVLSATPAPAVDAVPAGEVERLARIRTSMALLQQNSEGCARNHYGDDATLHGMPGWLIDTKADLDAFTEILAQWEADRG